MENFSRILCTLGILAIFMPSILCDYTHERHIIHVPVFIHYVHHHHILKKNKMKPRKKWKRGPPRMVPAKFIHHYKSSDTWY